ncbi:MAG: hypothetical protein Q3999_06555 [Buchananella hordeovulneris]|nr:hypothetical protein [Buchananella hordeovulneris]
MKAPIPTDLAAIQRPMRLQLLLLVAGVTLLGGLGGWFLRGTPGLWAGLLGGAVSALLAVIQLLSLRVLSKRAEYAQALLLGGFLVKGMLVLGAVAVGKMTPAISEVVLFITVVAGILGGTAIEVAALSRIRPILEAGARTSVPPKDS